MNDNIVGREMAQIYSVQTACQFDLYNLCHPLDEDGPSIEPTLSTLILLMDPTPVEPKRSLQDAVLRQIARDSFELAANMVQVISTAEVPLRSIGEVFSHWLIGLQDSLTKSSELPYTHLQELQVRLQDELQEACRPNAAQIKQHIKRHRLKDLIDPVLGWVRFNRCLEHFHGRCIVEKRNVEFKLAIDEAPMQKILPAARNLIQNIGVYDNAAKAIAAEKLLTIYNDNWSPCKEAPLTKAQFTAALRLAAISVDSLIAIRFSYDDGELFKGHLVEVSGTPDGAFHDADLLG